MRRTSFKEWIDKKERKIREKCIIDTTTSFRPAVLGLIMLLAKKNIPFKVYNLGAGVRRITTETKICPCCKREID